MKVLAVVNWKTTDKLGNPIAGLVPLLDVTKSDWRTIDATEEFPSQGQIFWPLAKDATERALFFVNARENPGQKDEYRVESVEPVTEVIDARSWGGPAAIRSSLTHGFRRTDLAGKLVFLWHEPTRLIGPIRLVAGPVGTVVLDAGPKDRVKTFRIQPDWIKTIHDGRVDRQVLGRELGVPSGFIDWDEDRMVLRRALTTAVELAKGRGSDPGLTKRLIDEAAEASASAGAGPDAELNQYRLQRAAALCAEAGFVESLGAEFCEPLLEHPSVKRSINELSRRRIDELSLSLRVEAQKSIASETTQLRALEAEVQRTRTDLQKLRDESQAAAELLAESRSKAIREGETATRAFEARLVELMKEPGRLLADVAVIRPFLQFGAERSTEWPTTEAPLKNLWPQSAQPIQDRLSLQRSLNLAFKASGIAPTSAIRIHAAIVAGLLPVVIGGAGLAALAAYARVVCGGRYSTLHVSPGFMQPRDLLVAGGLGGGNSRPPGDARLSQAARAATGIPSFSLFVCEGMNRAPTESYLLPFLQMQRAGIPFGADFGGASEGAPLALPDGIRLAATTVAGPTCLPVTPDLWSFAVAIEVDEGPTALPPTDVSEVLLSSELAKPGEAPSEAIDALLEQVPVARDCRTSLELFGASLSRFETDADRVRLALIDCVLVPQVALMSPEYRTQAMESLKGAVSANDDFARVERLEQRLRGRLG